MKKKELLKLLEPIPEDGEICMNELASDGTANVKMIEDIRYVASLKAWLIE